MSAALTIAGLGPGDPGLRTVATQRALDAATRIILRTAVHPGLDDLVADSRVVACDDLYEVSDDFDALYPRIAERVCEIAAETDGPVVYAVPGHPRFGERSVRHVLDLAAARGLEVTMLDAVSAIDVVATAIDADPMAGEVQLLDGPALSALVNEDPFAAGLLTASPSRPMLISQVYNREIASGIKLMLGRILPDDHPIVVVRAAGVPGARSLTECPLYALDRQDVDHLTSVWVSPRRELEAYRDPRTLEHIVARLRAPGGCPWDRQQTHATLKDAVVSEAYEVVDAIDADDPENLAEELGDLFLLVAMHAQLAEEAGTFTLEDVFEGISRKIIRRHPHVFGDREANTADEVVQTWNEIKAEEKASGGAPKRAKAADGQPHAMPALTRAAHVLKKHPLPPSADGQHDPGEQMLAAISAILADGGEPEAALRAALERHVTMAKQTR